MEYNNKALTFCMERLNGVKHMGPTMRSALADLLLCFPPAKDLTLEEAEAHVTRACEIFFNEVQIGVIQPYLNFEDEEKE